MIQHNGQYGMDSKVSRNIEDKGKTAEEE